MIYRKMNKIRSIPFLATRYRHYADNSTTFRFSITPIMTKQVEIYYMTFKKHNQSTRTK